MNLKLTPKLTLIFVAFAAILLMAVNAIVYNIGQNTLEAAAIAELESTAAEKVYALNTWADDKQRDIFSLSINPSVANHASLLLGGSLSSSQANQVHDRLVGELQTRVRSTEFLAVLLLDPQTGKVIVSTDPEEEGKSRSDRTYFQEGKKSGYITPIYYSQELQSPAMTVSMPVRSADGKLLAVLAGLVNLNELNTIIQRRSGVHQTDDAFLVNNSNLLVTLPRFLPDATLLTTGIHTEPVEHCLRHENGTIFANDYRDIPVIATYRWLPGRQMCLIVKISRAEALAPERSFAVTISWIGLSALLIASIVAVGLSHTIIGPIRAMQTAAQRYGQGDMTVRLPEKHRDELGLLAKEFNLMAASLEEKEDQLRLHSLNLEKQVEARTEELRQSQMRFQALIENAPDGIALLGLDGKLRQVTPSTLQILGYTLEDAQGQDPALLTHPDDLPYVRGVLNDLIQNPGKVVRAEYRLLHKNGSWRWLESTISNLIAEPGVEAIVFNYRDVTERKQAEEALSESEEKFKYIFDHSMVGKSITLVDGGLSVNKAFCDMLGYSEDELVHKKWQEITHPEDIALSSQMTEILLAGEKDAVRFTKRYIHKNGSTVWADLSIALRRDHESKPLYFMTVVLDITERKKAEDVLREKERLLSEAQRLGQIGSLSYDIVEDHFQFSDEMYYLLDVSLEKFQHNTKDFMALVYPADRPDLASWITDLKAGWQIRGLDFRVLRQNGEIRYLHCKGAVEFNSEGRPARFIGTAQDITERRMAEIQINQQIKRLTALNEIDRAIISGSDQQHTLNVILAQTISQLQVDAADILLLDSDGQGLSYAVGQGFHTKQIEELHVRLGESHAGRVARERRLIRIPNLNEQTNDLLFSTLVIKENFVSYIGVPLIVKREVRGILEVFHRTLFQPYQEWLDFFNTLAGQAAIAIENTTLLGNLQTSNQELSQAYDATIEGWSHAMDLRDRETEGHTRRVTGLTVEMARAMGIDESRLTHIRRGALLHDIGKLGIPDSILFKPGELTGEEWEMMQKHPEFAYDMLSSIQYLKPALPIPYLHHEKWDGTGYPLGLRGEQIPLEARIFAVVDVWDALRSDRPYRKAWTVEKTLEHIHSLAGSHFDPRVVEYFMAIVKS
jgi:PAS domain S-box-containing protein